MHAYLNLDDIYNQLDEISENGDAYGYDTYDESEYYYMYAELFTEIAIGANNLMEGIDAIRSDWSINEDIWNALSAALLGR